MKQLMSRATRVLSRLGASRRVAGEAVVLRDSTGDCFALPIEVLVAGASSREAAIAIDRRSLELGGIAGDDLAFRHSRGGLYKVPLGALAPARVPAQGRAMLEHQLEPGASKNRHEHPRWGWLELAGSLSVAYAPDAQDPPVTTALATSGERADAVDLPGLREARESYAREGWFAISGGVFGLRLARLHDEGKQCLRAASHEYEIESEDHLAIRLKRSAASGPVLDSVLHDPVVLSTLRAASGMLIVPTLASYYFYRGDDYITIHTDASHCPLALVVKVYGDPAPLVGYPELIGCSPDELEALAQGTRPGPPPRAQPMHFPSEGGIVFKGCELPHHRPPAPAGSGFIGVAQLCYRSVWCGTRAPRRMVASRPLVGSDNAGDRK